MQFAYGGARRATAPQRYLGGRLNTTPSQQRHPAAATATPCLNTATLDGDLQFALGARRATLHRDVISATAASQHRLSTAPPQQRHPSSRHARQLRRVSGWRPSRSSRRRAPLSLFLFFQIASIRVNALPQSLRLPPVFSLSSVQCAPLRLEAPRQHALLDPPGHVPLFSQYLHTYKPSVHLSG